MEARVSTDTKDVEWMEHAVQLAWLSNAVTSAYCVGCVITDPATQTCLSTGYSRELPGNTHAEECALRKLTEVPAEAKLDMYTTMEPCSERLSGNTPCCTTILESGRIRRVFIGATEPENLVQCDGVKILLNAGIEVLSVQKGTGNGELAKACLAPNVHILDATCKSGLRARLLRKDDAEELRELFAQSACFVSKREDDMDSQSTVEFWNSGSRRGACVEKAASSGKKVLAAKETKNIVGCIVFESVSDRHFDVLLSALLETIDRKLALLKMLQFIAGMRERGEVLSITARPGDEFANLLMSCGCTQGKGSNGKVRFDADLTAYCKSAHE